LREDEDLTGGMLLSDSDLARLKFVGQDKGFFGMGAKDSWHREGCSGCAGEKGSTENHANS
jgi:hypothetical protein